MTKKQQPPDDDDDGVRAPTDDPGPLTADEKNGKGRVVAP
jgi:hypothetical protein